MQPKKILMAGSHGATTALAVIKEIKFSHKDWEIYWLGKKWAGEAKKSESLEYKVLPQYGVKFISVDTGKVENKFTRYSVKAFFKIFFGFFVCGYKILKIRPDIVLSFGGSAGFLSSFWGKLIGKKVIIHEQTFTAGRANILSSYFADKIALSRISSKKYFPKKKIVVTGNPISSEITKLANKLPRKDVKTILITGGSRGSLWINNAVLPIISKLTKKYKVIWISGDKDYKNLQNLKKKNLEIYGQINPDKYAKVLSYSDIIIARAGANTVSELIMAKKPCILVPIPWSYKNEQNTNAEYVRDLGLAKILQQKDLNPNSLYKEVQRLIAEYPKIIEKVKDIVSEDESAPQKLTDLLYNIIKICKNV